MKTIRPQYIKDADGEKSLVVLTAKEFDELLKEPEELEDIKHSDEAKKEEGDERILFTDYVDSRKSEDV